MIKPISIFVSMDHNFKQLLHYKYIYLLIALQFSSSDPINSVTCLSSFQQMEHVFLSCSLPSESLIILSFHLQSSLFYFGNMSSSNFLYHSFQHSNHLVLILSGKVENLRHTKYLCKSVIYMFCLISYKILKQEES